MQESQKFEKPIKFRLGGHVGYIIQFRNTGLPFFSVVRGLKLEIFSVTNPTNSDQCCLSFGIDNSFVHCSFWPSCCTSDGWLTRPVTGSPPLYSFVLCSSVKHPLWVWETGCLSRQVKDRSVKSDREWEGLAEEENLMGKSECSGSRVVVSLTYLLCATHETFSCSSHFFPHHLSSSSLLSPLSLFPPPLVICRLFSQCWDRPTECFMRS